MFKKNPKKNNPAHPPRSFWGLLGIILDDLSHFYQYTGKKKFAGLKRVFRFGK